MLKSVSNSSFIPSTNTEPTPEPVLHEQEYPAGGEFLRRLPVRQAGFNDDIMVFKRPEMPELSEKEKQHWHGKNPISEIRCDLQSQKVTLVSDNPRWNLKNALADKNIICFDSEHTAQGTEEVTMRLLYLCGAVKELANVLSSKQVEYVESAQLDIFNALAERDAHVRGTARR